MDGVSLNVSNALTGEKMIMISKLPWTSAASIYQIIMTLLGHRPCRRVDLRHEKGDAVLAVDDIRPSARLHLKCVVTEMVTEEMRTEILARLYAMETQTEGVLTFFRSLSEAERDDKHIVTAAVAQHPDCLEHASSVCRDDEELLLPLVQKEGYIIHYGGPNAGNSRQLILAALEEDGNNLDWIPQWARDDEEIVLAAVKSEPTAWIYASERCQRDRTIAIAAVTKDLRVVHRLPLCLRDDEEIQRIVASHGTPHATDSFVTSA